MVQKYFIIILTMNFITPNKLSGQSSLDFLNSCISQEIELGARSIVLSANLCSACSIEPVFDGFLFAKDSLGLCKLRYLKYKNGHDKVTVLKDSTIYDSRIQSVFGVLELYEDSIFFELGNINNLIEVIVVKNGDVLRREAIMDGKLRYLGVYNKKRFESSLCSVLELNEVYEKAFYYWLLSSFINNYLIDNIPSRLPNAK